MNHKELVKDWKPKELYRFDRSLLESKGLNEETVEFLATIGLPTSAAPFLGFADSDTYKEMQSIFYCYETYVHEHTYLLSIGFDGAGDPICIDLLDNNRIVALNHEDDFKPLFMNSSVKQLFKFLTIYKRFGEELIRTRGKDAFLNSNFTDNQLDELINALKVVDEKALENNTFWKQEVELLLANREYYLNLK